MTMSTDFSEPGSSLPPLPQPAPPRAPYVPPPKVPVLAAVLSGVFPGIGQLYNGQPAKAFVFFFAFVGSIYGMAEISPFPFAFLGPFVWVYGIIDAYRSASLLNARSTGGGTAPEEEAAESPAWGMTLIAVGVLLLANNFGWVDLAALRQWWPLLLIAAGISFLVGAVQKGKGSRRWPQ